MSGTSRFAWLTSVPPPGKGRPTSHVSGRCGEHTKLLVCNLLVEKQKQGLPDPGAQGAAISRLTDKTKNARVRQMIQEDMAPTTIKGR
ncbi:hypothetical protein EA795_07300 [Stutzerimonas nitrititolerans]|uniref:Uncharacterized protein n=1 Tax=Stutzerimonas nitrititolerans TaxID=2482751 RepID=A0ABX9V698_9GAMM|nr:hypothetical protein EA795_07300 [Stutzerimonas nitrititolerans]